MHCQNMTVKMHDVQARVTLIIVQSTIMVGSADFVSVLNTLCFESSCGKQVRLMLSWGM